MYYGRIVKVGVRRVLGDTSFDVFDSFKGFMGFRPVTLAFLDRRRRDVIRYDQVGVLCGIFVANFASF